MGALPLSVLKAQLESLYHTFHQEAFRAHDPVSVVWAYTHPTDQEIVGLWAALFAWGRREVVIRKVRELLNLIGPSPSIAVRELPHLPPIPWAHRTWSPTDIQDLWQALHFLYKREHSLANFFWKRRHDWEEAIAAFQEAILREAPHLQRHIGHLRKGSASKRLLLWLRWMIRKDCIDPGPWEGFSPAWLFTPIDVHVFRWMQSQNLIPYRNLSWRTVCALTEVFRQLSPADPLRYDFALVTAGALGYLTPRPPTETE